MTHSPQIANNKIEMLVIYFPNQINKRCMAYKENQGIILISS